VRQGIFVPPFDEMADLDRLVKLAQCAERSDWDGLFLWDHLLYSEPVVDILDPYICLAAMAAATSSIQLGPMVTPLVRRRPAVLARQVVTLDKLSHGRLILGLGIGDDGGKGELSSFGEIVDAPTRGRALNEGLEVLTGLLSGEPVRFHGEHYKALDVVFRPVAERPGGVPIWMAARWPNPAPIRRAAKYQGVVVIQMSDPSDLATLREMLQQAGADLNNFDIVINGQIGDDPTPWFEAGASWFLTQFGPYHLNFDEVMELVAGGPPQVRTSPTKENS
jgi:alkanesulfonate monooxygenase SsuD/methylene tetrahydromethanopterin reductase-like flavin-dependent oxidoreductase (luciferase family)